jgi:hypothetical protein
VAVAAAAAAKPTPPSMVITRVAAIQ